MTSHPHTLSSHPLHQRKKNIASQVHVVSVRPSIHQHELLTSIQILQDLCFCLITCFKIFAFFFQKSEVIHFHTYCHPIVSFLSKKKKQNKWTKPLLWTALNVFTVWRDGRGIHTKHLHSTVWPARAAKSGCKKTKYAWQSVRPKFRNPKFHW